MDKDNGSNYYLHEKVGKTQEQIIENTVKRVKDFREIKIFTNDFYIIQNSYQ